MDLRPHRWALRAALMFFVGVIPAILLFMLTLVIMPLVSLILDFVVWFAAVTILALLGIVGLWGATFRDEPERALPNSIVIPLVLCGLLVALPYLFAMASDALEDGGFSLVMAVLLFGPVVCAVYFLIEQLILTVRRRTEPSR